MEYSLDVKLDTSPQNFVAVRIVYYMTSHSREV